jgi:hypothetical protein
MRLVVSLIMDWLQLGKQTVRVFLLANPEKKEELQRIIEQRSSCVVVGWLPAGTAYDPETIETILNSRVREVIGGSSRVDLQACKLGTGRRFTTS